MRMHKHIHITSMLLIGWLSVGSISYAEIVSPPAVSNNVTVMRNINAAQCKSTWSGTISPEVLSVNSRFGSDNTGALAGVQSCSGCAFDSKTNSCICKTCYGYYN